jgi:hypothetical protein
MRLATFRSTFSHAQPGMMLLVESGFGASGLGLLKVFDRNKTDLGWRLGSCNAPVPFPPLALNAGISESADYRRIDCVEFGNLPLPLTLRLCEPN